ncbi:MAG: hypothetical protein ABJ251_04925 [Paracoccaceae bacterium]
MLTKAELEAQLIKLEARNKELQEKLEDSELDSSMARIGIQKTYMAIGAFCFIFTVHSLVVALGYNSPFGGAFAWKVVAMGLLILIGFVMQLLSARNQSGKIGGSVGRDGAQVGAFHQRFLSQKTLASEYNRFWRTLVEKLISRGVEPFSSDGESFGNLFLRVDVERELGQR